MGDNQGYGCGCGVWVGGCGGGCGWDGVVVVVVDGWWMLKVDEEDTNGQGQLPSDRLCVERSRGPAGGLAVGRGKGGFGGIGAVISSPSVQGRRLSSI